MRLPGMPFRVTVKEDSNAEQIGGAHKAEIAHPDILLAKVTRARLMHQKKLSGTEIRFIRRLLGVRAKEFARLFHLTPQYWSRCETESKFFSNHSEKLFRITAFILTFVSEPAKVIESFRDGNDVALEGLPENSEDAGIILREVVRAILSTELHPPPPRHTPLHFELTRNDDSYKSGGQEPKDAGKLGWIS